MKINFYFQLVADIYCKAVAVVVVFISLLLSMDNIVKMLEKKHRHKIPNWITESVNNKVRAVKIYKIIIEIKQDFT